MGKLDKHKKGILLKRIEKILENPQLGKPLHAPLQNYRSERIEHFRIVYTITRGTVLFVIFEHRKKAYD